MSNKQYYKVIRDAVQGNVVFEKKIFIDLINSKEFQRLHRISQLGGTFIAFPTANHNRFSHSIGTYAVTKKILKNIKNNYLSDYQEMVTLIAAMLHDIGHGPFSHAFELIHNIAHEKYSVLIILGNTEINKILNEYHDNLAEDVAQVINKRHPNRVMVQLISSQIDADRLDYLKRDSFFTGVSYSKIDLFWLIKNMEIINEKIVFNDKTIINIEQYLLGRFHMFNAVYLHKSSNAFEVMISNVFKRLKFLYKNNYQFKIDISPIEPLLKNDNQLSVDVYLKLDDYQILTLIEQLTLENDLILSQITNMIGKRYLLKQVSETEYRNFLKLCQKENIEGQYYSYSLTNKVDAYNSSPIEENDSIVVKTKDGSLKLIEEVSSIVKILTTLKTRETVYYIYPEVFNIWKK